MEMTGEKYWVGNFWQVFLLTGLSGEKIVCWAYPHERYYPYKLWYFNQGHNNNYVFFSEPGSYAIKFKKMFQHIVGNQDRNFNQANTLIDFLDKFKLRAKKEKIGDFCWLIHGISGQTFPWALKAPIPEQIPELTLLKIECSEGFLCIDIKNKQISEKCTFRLHFEIPNYSSVLRGLPLGREKVKLRIPFPLKKSFKIRYYLDYKGLSIPSTLREIVYSPF